MSSRSIHHIVIHILLLMPAYIGAIHALAQHSPSVIVAGKILDGNGRPLELVNVFIFGTLEGDVTDSVGKFKFTTRRTGKQELRASRVGFEPALILIDLTSNDSVYTQLILKETPVKLQEVVVSSSSYTTGDDLKGMTLRSLEVVSTPSAAADIFRAIQTFPGVVAMDEGSGLYVRGGDVSETVILLDQATVTHPYKYETPTGGMFGTIPPFLLKGTFFSSGGFSARYGNALSAVLAMESLDLPSRFSFNIGAGLAAGSVGASVPVIPKKFGIRVSGNHSFTDLMFRLNRVQNEFTIMPRGQDANLSVIYKYSNSGRLKIFNFVNTNRVGVRVDEPSFDGIYEGEETSWLHNAQVSDVLSNWFIKGSVSLNRYSSEKNFGSMQLNPSDESYKVRLDAERIIGNRVKISAGGEFERLVNIFRGTLSKNPNIFDPNSDVYHFNERISTNRLGVYSEMEIQLLQSLFFNIGSRMDYHSISNQIVFDPRLSWRYNLSKEAHLRFAWGIYQQFPQPFHFNSTSGNPSLGTQRAEHWIAGVEYSTDLFMARLEAYRKNYSKLVIQSKQVNYTNDGRGYAQGIDIFLKYGAFLLTPVNGWVSYSYLQSRRLQARDIIDQYVYEEAPSSFDITHNLTIVAKAQLIQLLSAALTFRYATGRPVTPIVGARYHPESVYFEPIYGSVNSERLPNFARLDASLSYFLPFGSANSAVFYVAVANLLDRANPIRYEYSRDYSERKLRTTDYRKFIYFGLVMNIGSLGAGN